MGKALYAPAPREKEEMVKIFEREFRREKTLDIAKKQAAEALLKSKKVPKGEQPVDPEQEAKAKEAELKTRLIDIDEKFFEKIAKDEADQEMIKARGQLHMEAQPENAQKEDMGSSAAPAKQALKVNLTEGDYTVTNTTKNAQFQFEVEAGGVMTSDKVNG